MANYNRIVMIGNLTRDPQLSYLPSNTPVVEFGLATNRKWKDQSGQMREDVCFIDCRAYGKQADTIAKYTAKGRQMLIEGRLQLDQWQDKDGNKRSRHRIFVENFQFLDSKPQGSGGAEGGQGRPAYQAPQQRQARPAPQQQAPQQAPSYDEPQGYDEPPPQGGFDEGDFGEQGQQGDHIPF